ncbi:MAG TPA: adenylate/guanylate cyclase domain-containing protein [Chitinophagaceae bacterium]|nr:adenylate/guanylate cyclase domain-containing protein [Chitinophagaceae bacterium]
MQFMVLQLSIIWKKFVFCFPLFFISLLIFSQPATTDIPGDTTRVNSLLQQSKENFTNDPDNAISLANEAKALADRIDFQKGKALALKNIGIVYYFQGKHLEALDYYTQSLEVFKIIGDNSGIANLYSNIGVVYYDRGDDAKALENYLQSLKFSELAGDKFRILIALNNVGGVYNIKPATYDKALEYYLKALSISEELGKMEESGTICVNIGTIYFEKDNDEQALFYFNKSLKAYGDSEGSLNAYNGLGKIYRKEENYELALQNHQKALALAEKLNNKISIVQSLMGLANVYVKKGDYPTALQYFRKAELPALEIHANHEIKDLYQEMALAYSKTKDYSNAFKYQTLFSSIKDTLYNIDTDKKLGTLQFDFDLQKKQGEINLLTKDMALTDIKLKRQQFTKKVLIVGLILVLLIALLIFRNYRIKVRTHKILDRQKGEIESLLLNILPSEVANELQVYGHAIPRNYEFVSVMFTDFKGFTAIADKMSPEELIQELNTCFVAFDDIIGKYGLEKIKTIGDSYMCAGGIPTADEHHVENMVKASLEICHFIRQYNQKRNLEGLESWDLRIGVHVGPVIAGVVGKKKYAYDIWGSTVNIASRLESNGMPGKVNISSSVFELIKDKYSCSYRGKINAKNIGDIDMYFLDGMAVIEGDETGINTNENSKTVPDLQGQEK